MKPDLDVAATLECDPQLLPHLPELLQDFEELGTEAERVIGCLLEAEVAGEISRALDLCCGKGGTSIALAHRFGWRVDGIDALNGFIAAATQRAADVGVDQLCGFSAGDLCEAVIDRSDYDLVVFGAVGPILGGITRTVEALMRPLRPGGWLVMDDSILLPGAPARPGFESHADLSETSRRIEASGAEIVASHLRDFEPGECDDDIESIAHRAKGLLERRPDLGELVETYLHGQREECAYLASWTRDVTWLLRRPL